MGLYKGESALLNQLFSGYAWGMYASILVYLQFFFKRIENASTKEMRLIHLLHYIFQATTFLASVIYWVFLFQTKQGKLLLISPYLISEYNWNKFKAFFQP